MTHRALSLRVVLAFGLMARRAKGSVGVQGGDCRKLMTCITTRVCIDRRKMGHVIIISDMASRTLTVGVVMILMTVNTRRHTFRRVERHGADMTIKAGNAFVHGVVEAGVPGTRWVPSSRDFERHWYRAGYLVGRVTVRAFQLGRSLVVADLASPRWLECQIPMTA